jgi:nucleoid-associated protein YgaU
MSYHPFRWMQVSIHKKTIIAIFALGLMSCASDEPVDEAITADDIHEIENDGQSNDSLSMDEITGYEETSLDEDEYASDQEGTEDTFAQSQQEAEPTEIMTDFVSPVDNTKGDWTMAPSDEDAPLEPATFDKVDVNSSDSFLTTMTDEKEIESSFKQNLRGIYVVQAGDSLSKIASKIYGSMNRWKEVAQANGIGGSYTIHPGDTLRFSADTSKSEAFASRFENLPREVVTVKKGDSLSKIAKSIYGKAHYWKVLMTLNEDTISSPNQISIGAKLKYVKASALKGFASITPANDRQSFAKTE